MKCCLAMRAQYCSQHMQRSIWTLQFAPCRVAFVDWPMFLQRWNAFLKRLGKTIPRQWHFVFLFLSLIAAAIFQRAIKWISSLKTEFSPIYYPRLCQRRLWWHFQIHINVEFHSVEGPSIPVRAKQERRNRKCLHAAVRLQLRLSGAACLWAPKFQAQVSPVQSEAHQDRTTLMGNVQSTASLKSHPLVGFLDFHWTRVRVNSSMRPAIKSKFWVKHM